MSKKRTRYEVRCGDESIDMYFSVKHALRSPKLIDLLKKEKQSRGRLSIVKIITISKTVWDENGKYDY